MHQANCHKCNLALTAIAITLALLSLLSPLSLFSPRSFAGAPKGLLTQGVASYFTMNIYMRGETEEQKDEYIVVDCTHTHTS